MIIDIHNHIWPDKIAPKIIDFFRKQEIGYDPVAPCTLSGLLRNMEETGADRCVVVDVALNSNLLIFKKGETRGFSERGCWI